MQIIETYSHLNGEEYLIVHHQKVYEEIKGIIKSIDAFKFITKISKEKTMKNKKLYSPTSLNAAFKKLFNSPLVSKIQLLVCLCDHVLVIFLLQ